MKNHIEHKLCQLNLLFHNNDSSICDALLETHGILGDIYVGEEVNPFQLDNLRNSIKEINGVHNILQIIDKEQEHD